MTLKNGIVVLAVYQGRPIAGAVFFLYRSQGLFKFGASDRSVLHLRANNLVMWEAISWLSRNGFDGLHFGRTDIENAGLSQFKRGWGTTEKIMQYYRYDLKNQNFVSSASAAKKYYKSLMRHLPISLMRLIGTILYRHAG
jgi:lipid II:glycine glycyltransferase (peptidoglycan interpeptide bridge formation enzyme)